MKKSFLLPIIGFSLVITVAAFVFCRSDVKSVTVDVPQMVDAMSVRIVTNAALDEVVGRYDGIQNEYQVDLKNRVILYHESQRLMSPDYRRHIKSKIREVGFEVQITKVGLNPPAPVPTVDGPIQLWPHRVTAVISVPEMKGNTDANIIVNAIAYARRGCDDPRISVMKDERKLTATYEGLHLADKNIAFAIACVGFDADDVPANLGGKDSVPHGWTAVQ